MRIGENAGTQPKTRRVRAIKTYQLDLLENGLDFVKSGIETYFVKDVPDPRAHKYAILHMFSGVVLLLKERLARIKPELVFKNAAEAGQPGARTTDFHETLARLKINGVIIDPTKLVILGEIRKLRNGIEHYKMELTLARTKEVIGELAAFICTFCEDELQFDVSANLSHRVLPRFWSLKEIRDRFMADAMTSAAADAEADRAYFKAFEDKYATISAEELRAIAQALQGETLKRLECPTCYESSVLLLEVGACENPTCRKTYSLKSCPSCMDVILSTDQYCKLCRGD